MLTALTIAGIIHSRKNKRKLHERALSKIKEIGGKLVVVPQPALTGAR